MFFDNIDLSSVKRTSLADLPLTPETNWRAPTSYPPFRQAIAIGFDFEVKENDFERGPGWSRGKASICGGSIDLLFRDGSTYTEYRPIRHEVDRHLNLDASRTIEYWRDVLQTTPDIPKFGANVIYDIGNATDEDIWVTGELHDCQFAEALLTQDDPVRLEFISSKYLGLHKESSILYEWCAKAYGGEPTSAQRSNIYRSSPKLAGPYGEQDAKLPRLNLVHQFKLLHAQGLWDLYRMECELIPLWVMMRKLGCRVDLNKAQIMKKELTREIIKGEKSIFDLTGKNINVLSPDDLAPAYDALNIKYPITPKTKKGSFTAPWLMDQTDPLSELILEVRKFYKLRDTFIESYILKSHVNGRIHGQFHPLRNEGSRGEAGGTVTGRLSSSTPDLQNIPSRTKLGKQIMTCFLPDEGHLCFENGDYSQIEYRMFMHYAVGPLSDEFRQKYIDDPDMDYHTLVQQTIKEATGIYIPRNASEVAAGTFATGRMTIKEPNFGLLFGLGLVKLCGMAHCPLPAGKVMREAYFKAIPFIKPSQQAFINEAKALGYITTILNRRYRFDLWEPISEWDEETQSYVRYPGFPYQQAIREYGSQIQRAGTHKSMAGRCQGSAADNLKKAMWRCLKDGVYAVAGYPKLTVHDSNGRSVIDDSPQQIEAGKYMHWIMENALALRVPVKYELERGPSWGKMETAFNPATQQWEATQ
jgi:DNA polymerase-1